MPKKSKIILDILNNMVNVAGATLEALDEMLPIAFRKESSYYKELRRSGHNPKKIDRAFHNLLQRGILNKNLHFTKKGKSWLKNTYRHYFTFSQPAADKKWRVVLFDIPQEHNKSRNKLRARLKLWGFFMLQESVFVAPYKCEEEIAEICERLSISDYVDILLTDAPGFRTKEIKKFFELDW